ncbi:isoleucine--tRNA ligase [Metasolibacillus meyeri]|uniref:Isoleucine--tRNA ligase n=1 Tax=Metasolibacillus meyeri TaxID=1071052 RepID=A0AAW9NGN8_9BACL|nr:isoleucine--tRNA ligase [Metasolibacillus meyeri]MEC1177769.1 isoleucine--tRNA ligase [Metasolibacillus meyeri]
MEKETLQQREARILSYWQTENVFEKSIENRKNRDSFVFYEGPPTANGLPHVGHALGRTVKDVVARYKTMQGFLVERKAGWDTHGLPVELGVEKQLGISGKQEIERYGIEPFVQKCKESVFTYEKIWRSFTEQLGYWVDMDHPYVTLDNSYIESVWHILSKVHQDKLLYKGHRVSPYCPSCQTSLSSHEVAQGYKDVKDLSATVKFQRVDSNEIFLGWTTTPWTLPANVALAMNPNLTYVKAQLDDEVFIVAKSLALTVLGENVTILSEHKGIEFEQIAYKPPFNYISVEQGHVVVMADYVTETSGTGIVHIAPAHGEDDYQTVKEHGLSFVNVVDLQGRYTSEISDLAGRFVKDCDVDVIKLLAASNLLFHKEKYEHSYPHCWRCDSPLLYYATDSWFIQMSTLKEQLLANNNTVTWYPDHIKEGRFGKFLENVVDWNISRNRYWGTPLNVWICKDCGHEEAPESVTALRALAQQPLPEDLHKPYIDNVVCTCPKCHGAMQRTPEVIDVWFDSGSMPFAQHHYPFEQETFHKQFPADVVIEGIDQTRGFFYSLLAVSTLYKGQAPYKNVLSLGHVLDEQGQKMSKSKGNALDPIDLINSYGADALRWALLVDSSPWNPKRFSTKIVQEAKSKLLDTLENTFSFYQLYAGIDQFTFDASRQGTPTLLDKWVLSRLHTTITKVTTHMDDYQFTQGCREIAKLMDDVSNWYVRRSRQRFWASGFSDDKRAAFNTLHTVLSDVCRLLAPFTPFMAEHIYMQLHNESVHLQDYPTAHVAYINVELEEEMATIVKIVELGRSIRNTENLKVKQPLAEIIIGSSQNLSNYNAIIQDELNIKNIQWLPSTEAFVETSLKLNFKTAGAAFGKQVNAVKSYVETMSAEEKNTLLREGNLTIQLTEQAVTLEQSYLLTESLVKNGYALAEDGALQVLLYTHLTDDLIAEGYVRDFIRYIQDQRKQLNYPIEKYIDMQIICSPKQQATLQQFEALLRANVLVKEIQFVPSFNNESAFYYTFAQEELKFSMGLN